MKKRKKQSLSVLGVFLYKKNIHFLERQKKSNELFCIKKQNNDESFEKVVCDVSIVDKQGIKEDIAQCGDFRFSEISRKGSKDRFALTYLSYASGTPELCIAVSMDMEHWQKKTVLSYIHSPAHLVYLPKNKKHTYVLYHGKEALSVSTSSDLRTFQTNGVLSLFSALHKRTTIRVANVCVVKEGVFLLYFAYSVTKDGLASNCAVFGMFFDIENPGRVIWQSEKPLWMVPERDFLLEEPMDILFINETQIISFWRGVDEKLYAFKHWVGAIRKQCQERVLSSQVLEEKPYPIMKRHIANPILKPQEEHIWETKAAFNPTALCDDDGCVHIVYRAIGEGDVSVLGYALSKDGYSVDERDKKPMYIPRTIHEGLCEERRDHKPSSYSPYASGGGAWGGCEDPKLTRIEDMVYMTYVAYNGWAPPRVALTSISMKDFLLRNWGKWTHPVLISPPGKVAKSAAILPEKVNGKYVVFYRIFPDVLVDFVDSLDDFDGENVFLKDAHRIKPREGAWDAGKFSFGASPIKTKEGWLVIYHAVTGRQEWQGSDLRYKIGAMLLDLEHPEKVICRSSKPILEPDFDYENSGWKAGVVYPCGAVVRNGELLVYYGGADTVTCVAGAPIDEFLETLLESGDPELQEIHT